MQNRACLGVIPVVRHQHQGSAVQTIDPDRGYLDCIGSPPDVPAMGACCLCVSASPSDQPPDCLSAYELVLHFTSNVLSLQAALQLVPKTLVEKRPLIKLSSTESALISGFHCIVFQI